MIQFLLLISRQGKVRLAKWYTTHSAKYKQKLIPEVTNLVFARSRRSCNVLEWRDSKIIYKRYASLFFVACTDSNDNELLTLEIIHLYVETLDRYFGNVCELDLIFQFRKAFYVLDETLLAGELQEPSKNAILRAVATMDAYKKTGNEMLTVDPITRAEVLRRSLEKAGIANLSN